MCWVRVWSYARRSAFALLRVVFVGGRVSLVSGGVLVGWGGCAGISLMIVVCGVFVCKLFFNPSMSISAFFTAITIGVCAVAVSRFLMYRKRFLWFSTLKFTPATISKKSNVFFSFVIMGWSSSASESSSSELPTFFLFFYVLLRGNLLHAASYAAPNINVNLAFKSSASSRRLSSCFRRSADAGVMWDGVVLAVSCVYISLICCSNLSIFLFDLASVAFCSNSIFCSIFFRYA